MITIITGVPGSGKTALCVDLITREYKDRIIFNDGLDDLALENTPVDAMKWHEDVPDGGLIIVDEVQRKWRPRGPAAKVPESIAALETHRHRGIDFIVITQNLRLVDQNVRSLAGRHLHIRDTGFLGRWLYEWPEADLNNNWKRCENKRRYKLPKHVFSLYKSASLHTKPVRTKPMVLYFLAFLLVAFVVLVGFLYQRLNPAKAQAETTSAATEVAAAAQVLQGLQEPASSGQETAKRLIDDRVDWLPRVTTHPESAPAYDDVRQVRHIPPRHRRNLHGGRL